MSSAFVDYFRCSPNLARFAPTGELSQGDGFFTFDGTVCYGRPSGLSPSAAVGSAPEVSDLATCREGTLYLPFDLSEVVANLRHERYRKHVPDSYGLTASTLARTLYYGLRPYLSLSARKHLQKIGLRGWERIAFPCWPVDVSVEQLMRSVFAAVLRSRRAQSMPFIWFWPDGAPGCAIVTHDVEDQAGRDFCNALMDLDEEFDIPSSFQVIPEGRYHDSQGLADSIRARGFEVNVHDLNHDGRLFQEKQRFLERAKRINDYACQFQSRGFRSGAMYREQAWYDAFEFSYDMSVPNVASLDPQRGGCCTVMPYFVGKVLELPLTTVQDYSLFHVLGDYSTSLWSEQMRRIGQQNGLASFVTHPDYLIEERAQATYRDLLAKLGKERHERKLWISQPSEVDRWWRDREQMTLVPVGDHWRVEGPSSDRARVAYAVLEDGQCVYRTEMDQR